MSDPHYGAMYPSPPPWPPQGPPTEGHTPSRPSRWPTYAPVLIAFVAVGIATASLLRPPQTETPPPKAFTAEEVQEAKTNVCNAYSKVARLITVVGRKDAGADVAGAFAVAVNARLGIHAGAQYAQTALENNPATPPELAEAIARLSAAYYEMAIDRLGDAPDEETSPLVRRVDDADAEIKRICK